MVFGANMDTLVLFWYAGIVGVSTACFYVTVPLTLNILIHSTLLIIIGSVNSVRFMIKDKISRTNWDEDTPIIETVGTADALKFPIIGSWMLFGLYVLVKYAGANVVSGAMTFYFMLIGMESFKGVLNNYTSIGKIKEDEEGSFKYPILLKDVEVFGQDFSLSKFDLLCLTLSIICALLYVATEHWITNNILGIVFTLFALENMFLGSFQIGAIMLVGLFFYDIFWVFGTDVMETVAKNINGPIKLLFPKKVLVETKSDLSLLGLGDIIIPGIFVALCLRYDFLRHFNKHTKNRSFEAVNQVFQNISKPYFWACIAGYIIGIMTTVFVMLIFQKGQPALLYLVPGCLGSVIVWAFLRKELTTVFHYSEDTEIESLLNATKKHWGVEDKVKDKKEGDENERGKSKTT